MGIKFGVRKVSFVLDRVGVSAASEEDHRVRLKNRNFLTKQAQSTQRLGGWFLTEG